MSYCVLSYFTIAHYMDTEYMPENSYIDKCVIENCDGKGIVYYIGNAICKTHSKLGYCSFNQMLGEDEYGNLKRSRTPPDHLHKLFCTTEIVDTYDRYYGSGDGVDKFHFIGNKYIIHIVTFLDNISVYDRDKTPTIGKKSDIMKQIDNKIILDLINVGYILCLCKDIKLHILRLILDIPLGTLLQIK